MLTWFRRRLAAEDGLSLMEIMAAMLILGVVLSALASTSISAIAGTRKSESEVQANQILNDAVEDLRARPIAGVAPATTAATVLPVHSPWTAAGVTYTPSSVVRWVDEPCNGSATEAHRQDYLRLDVRVTWTERNGTTRTIASDTFRALTLAEWQVIAPNERRPVRGTACSL